MQSSTIINLLNNKLRTKVSDIENSNYDLPEKIIPFIREDGTLDLAAAMMEIPQEELSELLENTIAGDMIGDPRSVSNRANVEDNKELEFAEKTWENLDRIVKAYRARLFGKILRAVKRKTDFFISCEHSDPHKIGVCCEYSLANMNHTPYRLKGATKWPDTGVLRTEDLAGSEVLNGGKDMSEIHARLKELRRNREDCLAVLANVKTGSGIQRYWVIAKVYSDLLN